MSSRNRINKFILVFIFICVALPISLIAEDDNMNNPFGVLEFLPWCHDWNDYKYSCPADLNKAISLMKEAGVGWIRMDFLWGEIEPRQGEFDFAKYDTIVDLVRENNINILGILHYSADWASSCGSWNCSPRDNSLFVSYAGEVIRRYKDKIKYWEVWNEPDSFTYWKDQDGLVKYCSLLKDVYIAAKKIDPECKILNGGLANSPSTVNRLYENGTKDYFDIMNIHIFTNPAYPYAIKSVLANARLAYKIMKRNGDGDKKIWVTEIGCPGVKNGARVENWWLGRNPNEKKQGEWVKKVYENLLDEKNIEKVFWAFFRDCRDHWNNGIDYFGLVRWDFSLKPSFKAYKESFEKWKNK